MGIQSLFFLPMKVASILFALALVSASYQVNFCPALKEVADDGLKIAAACVKSHIGVFPPAAQGVDYLEKKAEGVVNDAIGRLCGRRRRALDVMGAIQGAMGNIANVANQVKNAACGAGAAAACGPVMGVLEKALEAGLAAEGFPVVATSCIFDEVKKILTQKCQAICKRRQLTKALRSRRLDMTITNVRNNFDWNIKR